MQLLNGILLLSCCCLFLDNQLIAQEWELTKKSETIQVFTRKIADYDTKEYKAVTTVKTDVATLNELLRNHDNLKNWFVRCPVSERLEKVSDDEFYVYFLNDAPWPVADRDNITHMRFERLADSTQFVFLKGVPNYLPINSGIVRIPKMEAHWEFKPLGNGHIQVTQQVKADLGGKVPTWLINMAIVEAPFQTMENLRKQLKN
ncbi:MAG: START domain-containing protein [Bacteroidota bacterium]